MTAKPAPRSRGMSPRDAKLFAEACALLRGSASMLDAEAQRGIVGSSISLHGVTLQRQAEKLRALVTRIEKATL